MMAAQPNDEPIKTSVPVPGDRLSRVAEAAVIALLAVMVFSIVRGGVNDYTMSDPLGSLLASQNLVEHGTFYVDAYRELLLEHREMYSYRFFERRGHVLPFYPPGTIIFSTPFVWIANLQGYDMATFVNGAPVHDMQLQRDLAAGIVAVCFVVIYLLCRCYFGPAASLALTLPLVMGGPITSALGVALWSTGFEVVFILLSLLIIVADRRDIVRLNPYLLGSFLSAAFYCRPTAVTFIVLASLVVLLKSRSDFIKMMVTGLVFAAAFYLFSQRYYGQPIPRYYRPGGKIGATHYFWSGLYGVLLSPSRGILVFSPYLVLTFARLVRFARKLVRQPLVWLCLIWFGAHTVSIASFGGWWGGHTYGPRLMADSFPALVVLTVLVADCAVTSLQRPGRWVASGAFAVLAAAAIWINTNQGLYNKHASLWSAAADIDRNRQMLMDWRYPQFLADQDMLDRLRSEVPYHEE